MDISKRDLGRFVTARRREVGLTQRELAARLHVTESAVSKWERGLSYPDITMVQALAAELGVSGQELISASEDHEGRAATRDAGRYRSWRSAILWSTGIAYAATLLTTAIVNLSVSHTLDWFWIVLAAVGIAASLTTLPLLGLPRSGWWALGGATVSLLALLIIVWAQHSSGTWVWIAIAAVAAGLLCIFTPVVLRLAPLPAGLARHRTVLSLAVATVALVLLLLVIALAVGSPALWLSPMLPLAAIGLVPVWAVALSIRYLPGGWAVKTAVVSLVLGVAVPAVNGAVARVLGEPWSFAPNIFVWNDQTIEANILVLTSLAFLAVAVGAGIVAGVSRAAKNLRLPRETLPR